MKSIRAFLSQKTKILCTVGPAIASEEKLSQIIMAGANAFRLNMSHSAHAIHQENILAIRKVEKQLGVHIPIVADLQGPKIRVSDLPDGVIGLQNGREVYLGHTGILKKFAGLLPNGIIVPVEYPTLAKDVKKGDVILFDDGLIKVQVLDTDGHIVKVLVVNGGLLKSRKGMNLPHVNIRQPSMTTKDKADLEFAIANNCDYVAVSFVRISEDIRRVKEFLAERKSNMLVIAKIEKPEAVVNIEKIIQASDAIMVARGDLGVEISAAQVPLVQKKIITLCNRYAKPVITATQMLESMVQNPRPTRAEASDVANAVLDGTDAVMLSAETSVGAYPIEAVTYMRMICNETEKEVLYSRIKPKYAKKSTKDEATRDSVAGAVSLISEEDEVSGIVTMSLTGSTARMISKRRTRAPIIAVTQMPSIARRVGLFWGVSGLVIDRLTNTDDMIEFIKDKLVRDECFAPGEKIIFTIGRPLSLKAKTNMISIEVL